MDMTNACEFAPAAPAGISAEEWQVGCNPLACYQLIDLLGMSNMAASNISAAIPGLDQHFLLRGASSRI